MKIYDCFLFFNELELLELRLNMLADTVDKFVIVEAKKTFTGNDKPLYFEQNKERFSKFKDKITHHVIEKDPTCKDQWEREVYQRNCIKDAVDQAGIQPEDIAIISDADEIPGLSRSQMIECASVSDITNISHEMFFYFVNMHKESNWIGSRIVRRRFLDDKTPDQVRNIKSGVPVVKSGWHWSFLGGYQKMVEKIEAYGHQEFNNALVKSFIKKNVQEGKDIFFRGSDNFTIWEIDDRFPDELRNNRQKYSSLIRSDS
jgi:beta-1,4-mannosyl-glycoprotein beta-1,4-N-acetylglucosaminyltransferase